MRRVFLLACVLATLSLAKCAASWNPVDDEMEKIVLEKLERDEDRQLFCPQRLPAATKVHVAIDINSASLEDNTCGLDFALKMKWNNPRITFDNSAHPDVRYVTINTLSKAWYPDLHFPGELGKKTTSEAEHVEETVLWIYPNGDVFFSVRMQLDIPTQISEMHTDKTWPARNCTIFLESYRCSSDHVVLAWENDPHPVRLMEREGVQVMNQSGNPTYSLSPEIITGKPKEVQVRAYKDHETFSGLFAQLTFH